MAIVNFFDSKECEWADMTVTFAGAPIAKVTGIKYGVKQNKEHLYAAGNKPISIQSSKKEFTGEIKMLKGALDAINTAAVAVGGDDITDLAFDLVIFYKPKGARPPQTDTVIGVQISDYMKGWDTQSTHMEITCPFLAMDII